MEGGEATARLRLAKRLGEARTALATMATRWRPGTARAEAGRHGARGRRPEGRS
jgi:hypothetical protein